jgi:hypothetical protein
MDKQWAVHCAPLSSSVSPGYSPPAGVKYNTFLSVLNYVYHGEVHVAQKELESFIALAGIVGVLGFTSATASPWVLPSPKPPYLMDIVVPVPPQYRASPQTLPAPQVLRYEYEWPDVTYDVADDKDQYDAVPTVSPGCSTSPPLHSSTREALSPHTHALCERPRDAVLPHEARPCDARRGVLDAASYDHHMKLLHTLEPAAYAHRVAGHDWEPAAAALHYTAL